MAIARTGIHPKPDDPKVWFTSPQSFAKLLSKRKRVLAGPDRRHVSDGPASHILW